MHAVQRVRIGGGNTSRGPLCVVRQRRSVSMQRPHRRYRRYCGRFGQALGPHKRTCETTRIYETKYRSSKMEVGRLMDTSPRTEKKKEKKKAHNRRTLA